MERSSSSSAAAMMGRLLEYFYYYVYIRSRSRVGAAANNAGRMNRAVVNV